jgi:hypothetical protein
MMINCQKRRPQGKTWIVLICSAQFLLACEQQSSNLPDPAGPQAASPPPSEITAKTDEHPQRVYWGDLHLHTRYSFDSYAFGNTALSPDHAFRFAKGETIAAHNGEQAKLETPLDFLLVSDHAEFLGVLPGIAEGDEAVLSTALGKRWADWLGNSQFNSILDEYVGVVEGRSAGSEYVPDKFLNSVWRKIGKIADQHNEPGKFTAFIGYEWTSMIEGDNLHRVILFDGNAEQTASVVPFSAIDSIDPENLWSWLERFEAGTGGKVMAIPHNGNISDGRMFAGRTLAGEPLSASYAETRNRWERIYEMTQVKGDAEAHPLLSPNDEFADFENWDKTDIGFNVIPEDRKRTAFEHGYARPALKLGLKFAASLGVNPFQFGLIGSTDSHTAMSTADADNYYGKFPDSEPGPDRMSNSMGGVLWKNRQLTASGYAAVWAAENTRRALFDALERREVYASTGPRIIVRLFVGWDFSESDLEAPDMAARGYLRGVPMGGELKQGPPDAKPTLMITAAKDPNGANLDRVQVIKGWLRDDGSLEEQVFDVAWSDGRIIDTVTGRLPLVGSTVDLDTATYRNDVGAALLATVWRDPEFDPNLNAFYYIRVLEIPTPRWTTYDAVRYGLERPDDVPATIQERAYTSPVWYRPNS